MYHFLLSLLLYITFFTNQKSIKDGTAVSDDLYNTKLEDAPPSTTFIFVSDQKTVVLDNYIMVNFRYRIFFKIKNCD